MNLLINLEMSKHPMLLLVSKILTCLILLFSLSTALKAQDFLGNLVAAPPYSASLKDYANVANPRLTAVLNCITCNNVELAPKRIKLRMTMSVNNTVIAYSNDIVTGESVMNLQNGGVLSLGLELCNYFKFENLQGISADNYNQLLADGSYTISFQVLDFLTNAKIGTASTTILISTNDAPILIAPRNGENVQVTTNTTIPFSWSAPISQSGFQTNYEYSLVGIADELGDINQQFLTTTPIKTTTTNVPNQTIDAAQLQLVPAKTYAWRVHAIANSNSVPFSLFKKDGYSEIFTFKYNGACAIPTGLQVQAKAADQINVSWSPSTVHYQFRVAYRKYSTTQNNQWVEQTTTNNFLNLTALEPNTTYEIKLGGVCGANLVSYTQPLQATTLSANQVNGIVCGQLPSIDTSKKDLLPALFMNDIIMAGDFPVTITRIIGSNGNFSGEGWIKVPWLADTKIAVKFTSITVNTDKKLIGGFIVTTYDPTLPNIADIDSSVVDIEKQLADFENALKDLLAKINAGITSLTGSDKTKLLDQLNNLSNTRGGLQSVSSTDYKDKINQLIAIITAGGTLTKEQVQELLTKTQEAKANQQKITKLSQCFKWDATIQWIINNYGKDTIFDFNVFAKDCQIYNAPFYNIEEITNVLSQDGTKRDISVYAKLNPKFGIVTIDKSLIRIPVEIVDNQLSFNFDIYYKGTTNFNDINNIAVRLSVKGFENYKDLLQLLGFKFGAEAQTWYVNAFTGFLQKTEVANDCKNLSFVYEEMPNFVSIEIGKTAGNGKIFSDLSFISNCPLMTTPIGRSKSVRNILYCYDRSQTQWWIDKINTNPDFFMGILSNLSSEWEYKTMSILTDICLQNQTNSVFKSVVTNPYFIQDGTINDNSISYTPLNERLRVGTCSSRNGNTFSFGRKIYVFDSYGTTSKRESDCLNQFSVNPSDIVESEGGSNTLQLPAFVAYIIIKDNSLSEKIQFFNDNLGLLLPESYIYKVKLTAVTLKEFLKSYNLTDQQVNLLIHIQQLTKYDNLQIKECLDILKNNNIEYLARVAEYQYYDYYINILGKLRDFKSIDATFATEQEVKAFSDWIKSIGVGSGSNIARIRFTKNNNLIYELSTKSGFTNLKETEQGIFYYFKVGVIENRNLDSEFKALTELSKKLGATSMNVNALTGEVLVAIPNVYGELELASKFTICPSCKGTLIQFKKLFPNIKIKIIDGIPN